MAFKEVSRAFQGILGAYQRTSEGVFRSPRGLQGVLGTFQRYLFKQVSVSIRGFMQFRAMSGNFKRF